MKNADQTRLTYTRVGDVARCAILSSASRPRCRWPVQPTSRRVAANNIAGIDDSYRATQGSSVAKVFDLTAASTGANEKQLARRGLVRGQDYEAAIITQNSHAGYYPGASHDPEAAVLRRRQENIRRLIVGREGVDKRIDTIGAALRLGPRSATLSSLSLRTLRPIRRPRTR